MANNYSEIKIDMRPIVAAFEAIGRIDLGAITDDQRARLRALVSGKVSDVSVLEFDRVSGSDLLYRAEPSPALLDLLASIAARF